MENPQDLQASLADAVGDQVRAIGYRPFTGTGQAAFAATGGKTAFDKFRGGLRIVLGNVDGFVIKVLRAVRNHSTRIANPFIEHAVQLFGAGEVACFCFCQGFLDLIDLPGFAGQIFSQRIHSEE